MSPPPDDGTDDPAELGEGLPDNVVTLPTAPVAATPPPAQEGVEAVQVGPVPAELLLPAVEACLFATPGVVPTARLAEALQVPPARVEEALEVLKERLLRTGSGLRLVAVGDGWQLRTDARLAAWVAAARGGRPVRLSRAALETLAIVAFRQPVSKGVLDDVRGVDSGGVLRMLSDRGLVKVVGRAEEPGRPMAWGTTPAFLEMFGLRSLADLPTLRDLRALDADDPEESPVKLPPDLQSEQVVELERLLGGPRLVPPPEE